MSSKNSFVLNPWENTKFEAFSKYFKNSQEWNQLEEERSWIEVYDSNKCRIYLLNPSEGSIYKGDKAWDKNLIWGEDKLSDKYVILGRCMKIKEFTLGIKEKDIKPGLWDFITRNNETLYDDKKLLFSILKDFKNNCSLLLS